MYKRLDHIDALRGLAALAIILFHLVRIPTPNLPLPNYLNFISTKFDLGVPMFFIISGFSIFYSLSSRRIDSNWILNFYARRFSRIAPLFYFMLVFWLFRDALLGYLRPLYDIIINILFVYNFFPGKHQSIVWAGWPISIEMFFYLFAPFLFRLIDSFRKSILLLSLSLCFSAFFKVLLVSIDAIPKDYYYKNIATHLPFLSLGIVIFFIYQQINTDRSKLNLFFLFFIVTTAYLFASESNFLPIPVWLRFYHKYIWGLFLSSLLIILGNYGLKVFVNKVTQYCGKLSYSLYLGHPFIIYSLSPLYKKIYNNLNADISAFFVCILMTIPLIFVAAFMLYNLVENPVRKFSYKFINKHFGTSARPPMR